MDLLRDRNEGTELDPRRAPVLLPAAALVAGAVAAFHLVWLPVPLLAGLAVLGVALGGLRGACLAAGAAGLIAATIGIGLPERPPAGLDAGRPVELVARVAGHWARDDDGWTAPARAVRLRQGLRVEARPFELVLHLPNEREPPDGTVPPAAGVQPSAWRADPPNAAAVRPEPAADTAARALADESAARGAPPPFGSAVRVKGYLRRSPGFANAVPVPPGPWRLRVKSRLLLRQEAPPGAVARLSGRLRARVEKAYAAAGPETEGKALARGLVLGDPSAVPLAWKRGLRAAGLSHVLSVSGLHLGLLAAAVLLAGTRLPRRLRLTLVLVATALYVLLVGPLPALVRSAWMALLMVAALLSERPPAPANALAWAAALLVLEWPAVVEDPSFQLTVSATAGLLLLAPRLAARWRRLPPSLRAPLAATAGAQLASLPWSLPRFHLLTLMAPLANLLFVPWTGLALLGALLWSAVAVLSPAAAAAALPALDFLAAPFGWPARIRPQVWLALPLVASPAAAALLAAGLALLLAGPHRRWRALGAASALAGVMASGMPPDGVLAACDSGGASAFAGHAWDCASAFVCRAARAPARQGAPELAMLDVGQGDAILLRDGRHAVLVDGGGWERGDLGGRVLLPALAAEGVRHLDAVAMTHPDRDHCRGLVDLASYVSIREVWIAPGWEPTGCAADLLTLPGITLRVLWTGERATIGRWTLTALHPTPGERRGTNDRSLVLLAAAEQTRVLLTGDIEEWAEHALVSRYPGSLHADILKIPHHGSRTSSTETFLSAVHPRLALISAGPDNPYHHPSDTVLDRLSAHHIPTLRTDRHGIIRIQVGKEGLLHISLPGTPRTSS